MQLPQERSRQRVRGVSPELRLAAQRLRRQMTPAELALWEALRMQRLGGLRFRSQHALGQFVLDFFCAEHRLAIEVDGEVHDAPDQAHRDGERTRHLESMGYRVIRFRNAEVLNDLPSVCNRISEACGLSSRLGTT